MKGEHLLKQYREKVSQQEFPFPDKILEKNVIIIVFVYNADLRD